MRTELGKIYEINQMLDAVFVLGRGWTINFGDGCGSFKFTNMQGHDMTGWITKETPNVLFDLMGWLSCVMPVRTSCSAILPLYMLPQTRPH